MVADQAGGAILAWEDLGSRNVIAQRLDRSGNPLWGGSGVIVAPASGSQLSPRAVSDGSNGVVIAWVDGRNGFCDASFKGACDIFAQRLSGDGERLWQTSGVAVTTAPNNQGTSGIAITGDGSGGAIIAWEDARPSNCCRIVAQRIDSSGSTVWNADGISVSPEPSLVIGPIGAPPQIVSDNAGGAIVAWLDVQVPSPDMPKIALLRLDGTGRALWPSGSVEFGAPSRMNGFAISGDGSGGVLATWSRIGPDGFDDIAAQKVDSTGQLVWQADGVSVSARPFAQLNADIVSDGAGGAIIVWEDERDGASGDCFRIVGNRNVYAQRISAQGMPVWLTNGVAISVAANSQRAPRAVSDGAGGAIVVWEDCRDYAELDRCGFGMDLYAQRINDGGTVLWDLNGTVVSRASGNQGIGPGIPFFRSVEVIAVGLGGAIVAWPDGRERTCQELTPNCELFAQKLQ
jgi:hypothetical protein